MTMSRQLRHMKDFHIHKSTSFHALVRSAQIYETQNLREEQAL